MVGVFFTDESGTANNFISGYINPNSSFFAVFNSDKPIEVVDGTDAANSLVNRGPSVYTSGTVTALGSVSAGTSVTASTTVTAQKFLTSPVATTVGTSGTPLTASAGRANLSGLASTVVYTTQVTATSMVFVTINNATPRSVTVVPAAGSFAVYSSSAGDTSTFYWLVIN
jgi:hypothetical protein